MLDSAASAQARSKPWFRRSRLARRAVFTQGLLLILLGQALFPQALTGAPRWLKLQTPSFELLTAAGESDGRKLILYLEQVRSFFAAFQGPAAVPPGLVHIIGFQSDKEFKSLSPSEDSAAFYVGAPTGDYIVLKRTTEEYYPLVIHEYVHFLVGRSGLHFPLWWYEGIAELYSTLKFTEGETRVGAAAPYRYDLLKKKALIDLAALIASDRWSSIYQDREAAKMFYAESWALVHMLRFSDPYRSRFEDFSRLLGTGTSSAAAFLAVFDKTTAQVQADLETYVQRGKFNGLRFAAATAQSQEPPAVSPASDLDVSLAIANISMGTSHGSAARRLLAGLSRKYPGNWAVEESFGYTCWYMADREEARMHFARAAAIGTPNAKTYLNYAGLLGETLASGSTLAALLEKALLLEPADHQTRLKLASMYLHQRRFTQVIVQLGALPNFGRDEVFQANCLLSQAYLGLGQIDSAWKSAEEARSFARTSAESSEVESLLESVAARHPAEPSPKLISQTPQER